MNTFTLLITLPRWLLHPRWVTVGLRRYSLHYVVTGCLDAGCTCPVTVAPFVTLYAGPATFPAPVPVVTTCTRLVVDGNLVSSRLRLPRYGCLLRGLLHRTRLHLLVVTLQTPRGDFTLFTRTNTVTIYYADVGCYSPLHYHVYLRLLLLVDTHC